MWSGVNRESRLSGGFFFRGVGESFSDPELSCDLERLKFRNLFWFKREGVWLGNMLIVDKSKNAAIKK
jgi:hypothetical protein